MKYAHLMNDIIFNKIGIISFLRLIT